MKRYYKILKTAQEVKVIISLYLKGFAYHGKLIAKLSEAISNSDFDIDNENFEKLSDALSEYFGISKSTLSFARRHPDENMLSEESLNNLRYIVENFTKAKVSMEFIKAQADQALFLQSLEQQPITEIEVMEETEEKEGTTND